MSTSNSINSAGVGVLVPIGEQQAAIFELYPSLVEDIYTGVEEGVWVFARARTQATGWLEEEVDKQEFFASHEATLMFYLFILLANDIELEV